MTRSVSFPMMQRSDSIRDLNGRRRFLSAPESRKSRKTEEFSQDFTLRKKSDPSHNKLRTGKMKLTCKQSIVMEKKAKKWRLNNSTESSECPSPDEFSSDERQRLLAQRGRAFTSPNITEHLLRSRTTSERSEEKDQVMPLPHIVPRRGWKSCNALANHSNGVVVHSKKHILLPRGSIPCNNGSNNLTPSQFKPKFKINHHTVKDSAMWKKIQKGQPRQLDARVFLKKNHSSLIVNSVPTTSVIKVAHRGP